MDVLLWRIRRQQDHGVAVPQFRPTVWTGDTVRVRLVLMPNRVVSLPSLRLMLGEGLQCVRHSILVVSEHAGWARVPDFA